MAEGWGLPGLARKWHYFRERRSLCGRWVFSGKDLEQGNDDHPANCKQCREKRTKEAKAE